MRGRKTELMSMAFDDLRGLGYKMTWPDLTFPIGENVRRLSRAGEQFHALIQVRSYQPSNDRYLVGILVPYLRRADQVIIWFERERELLMMPANELCAILDDREAYGDARYSSHGRQWRVDFHLDEHALSPQGSPMANGTI